MARIIAIADVLNAMTTDRPYQSGYDLEFSLAKIRSLVGTHFDGRVVDALDVAVSKGEIRLKVTPNLVEA